MRLLFLLLLFPSMLTAQPPAPPLSFVLVENERGRPMRGPIVEDGMMMELLSAQGKHPWMVRLQFTVSASYPYGPEKPGDHVQWSMMGTPVKSGLHHYVQFELFTCYCEAQQLVVQRDGEVMRIRVPNEPLERKPLEDAALARSGGSASPEVFRFRPGTFTFAELAGEAAYDVLEGRLAERAQREREAQHRDRARRNGLD
jgi:hypothetical protein